MLQAAHGPRSAMFLGDPRCDGRCDLSGHRQNLQNLPSISSNLGLYIYITGYYWILIEYNLILLDIQCGNLFECSSKIMVIDGTFLGNEISVIHGILWHLFGKMQNWMLFSRNMKKAYALTPPPHQFKAVSSGRPYSCGKSKVFRHTNLPRSKSCNEI